MNETRCNSHSGNRGRSGFSLIEVLLSVGILGVGMSMVAAIFPVAAREAQDSSNAELGSIMCDNALGIVKAILSGGQRDYGTITTATPSTALIDGVNTGITTITDSTKTWTTDQYLGSYLEITDGTAKGQSGRIYSMLGTSVNVIGQFPIAPPVGSPYRIVQPRAVADCGRMTSGTYAMGAVACNTVTDNTKMWSANQWAGWTCFFPAGYSAGLPMYCQVPFLTRTDMAGTTIPSGGLATLKLTMSHSDEAIRIPVIIAKVAPTIGKAYQLVLLADENTYTGASIVVGGASTYGVINGNTLHYPSGADVNTTARGCVLMATKPLVAAPAYVWSMANTYLPGDTVKKTTLLTGVSGDTYYTCIQANTGQDPNPAGTVNTAFWAVAPNQSLSSSDGAVIVVVAYKKTLLANRAGWASVTVSSIAYTAVNGSTVPYMTITGTALAGGTPPPLATLVNCTGSPVVFTENGSVAKITQVIDGTHAVLDRWLPLPRKSTPAAALVVQETNAAVSPAIAWKVTHTGSR